MQMIVARSEGDKKKFRAVYAFSTFFYPRLMDVGFNAVKRWTKKVDLFSQSLILIPVHLGMHWCLATIDMDAKAIVYYDSMGGNNKVSCKNPINLESSCHTCHNCHTAGRTEGSRLLPPAGALRQEGVRPGPQRVEADHRQEDPAADERI